MTPTLAPPRRARGIWTLLALLLFGCTEEPEWATLTFSYKRAVCERTCVGTQIIRVSEEWWGDWNPTIERPTVLYYAGMALYSSNSDDDSLSLDEDPMWGIPDPACAGMGPKDVERVVFDWDACDPVLEVYPPDDTCFGG